MGYSPAWEAFQPYDDDSWNIQSGTWENCKTLLRETRLEKKSGLYPIGSGEKNDGASWVRVINLDGWAIWESRGPTSEP